MRDQLGCQLRCPSGSGIWPGDDPSQLYRQANAQFGLMPAYEIRYSAAFADR